MGSCVSVPGLSLEGLKKGKPNTGSQKFGTTHTQGTALTFNFPPSRHDTNLNTVLFNSMGMHQKRSPSLILMEKILADRELKQKETEAHDTSLFDITSPFPQNRGSEKGRLSLADRTRRMSSIMNKFGNPISSLLLKKEDEDMDSYLHRAFTLLDSKGMNKISEEIIFSVLSGLRSKESLQTMFTAADRDKDGFLGLDEFLDFFRYIRDSDSVLAESADVYSALELNMNDNTVTQTVPVEKREILYDIMVSNLPAQAECIRCVAISPDGELYAVAHQNDCTVHVYTVNGTEVKQLTGHSDYLLDMTFSPDKKFIATASRDWTVILWDSVVGQLIQCIQHDGIVTSVAFSFNGKMIYTGCQDNSVRKFTVPKASLKGVLKELPNRQIGFVASLATQHTKNEWIVFSRSCDKGAIVADAVTLSRVKKLDRHEAVVWQTLYSPDDSLILTGCEHRLNIWSANSYSVVCSFDSKQILADRSDFFFTSGVFFPLAFERMLIVFTSLKEFYILKLDTRDIILDMTLPGSVHAAAVDFVKNGLICGDFFGNVYHIKLRS